LSIETSWYYTERKEDFTNRIVEITRTPARISILLDNGRLVKIERLTLIDGAQTSYPAKSVGSIEARFAGGIMILVVVFLPPFKTWEIGYSPDKPLIQAVARDAMLLVKEGK
jgi:hypothetical protein